MTFLFAMLGLIVVALAPVPAAAAGAVIGTVTRAEGPCTGDSDGVRRPLAAGDSIRLNETVATGAGARLALSFLDDTRLTVGEKSTVVLDDFVFQPGDAGRFHAAVTGPFRYVSGRLAAGAVRQASITTPFALLGVRGTDFWGGPIDGANGVVVFEGVVSVTNAAGTVVLSAGQGTDVAGQDGAPGAPGVWPADKAARAIATVTFP